MTLFVTLMALATPITLLAAAEMAERARRFNDRRAGQAALALLIFGTMLFCGVTLLAAGY